MDKKTGTILTIVGAVVALCLSLGCCAGGIWWSLPGFTTGDPAGLIGLILICPAILIWALPVLLWVFLVRGKEDGAEVAQMDI